MIERLIVGVPKSVVDRSHLPEADLKNFERVTGIRKTRRYNGLTIQMIVETFEVYRRQTTLDLSGIDCLIVVTQSPDRLSPCMAAELHNHLQLPCHVPAIDLNHACDGFVMGLWAARALGKRVLLVCADRLRYNKTPMESLIFSDACAIAIVTNDGASFPTSFFTNGDKVEKLYCGLNGEMNMDGNAVFDFVTKTVSIMIAEHEAANVPADYLCPHQANLQMNKLLEMRAGFKGKALYSIEEYGNQSMCSIPTALAINEKKILAKRVLLCGFGAGYTAACGTLWWPMEPVSTVVEI